MSYNKIIDCLSTSARIRWTQYKSWQAIASPYQEQDSNQLPVRQP
ncbi:MAG TPA: hypothetical protein VK184_21855 [Nostocaceae cyanobacterium]|nr:hypothetical protein [Nostocaceae cyanobacterium]